MKNKIKEQILGELIDLCYPDTRFHYDLSMFIPDFPGSTNAASFLDEIDAYKSAQNVFVTPDNSLINDRKKILELGSRKENMTSMVEFFECI